MLGVHGGRRFPIRRVTRGSLKGRASSAWNSAANLPATSLRVWIRSTRLPCLRSDSRSPSAWARLKTSNV